MKLEFSRQIFETSLNVKFKQIRPVGVQLFRTNRQTDGRTDRQEEVNSRFRSFADAPKTGLIVSILYLTIILYFMFMNTVIIILISSIMQLRPGLK